MANQRNSEERGASERMRESDASQPFFSLPCSFPSLPEPKETQKHKIDKPKINKDRQTFPIFKQQEQKRERTSPPPSSPSDVPAISPPPTLSPPSSPERPPPSSCELAHSPERRELQGSSLAGRCEEKQETDVNSLRRVPSSRSRSRRAHYRSIGVSTAVLMMSIKSWRGPWRLTE